MINLYYELTQLPTQHPLFLALITIIGACLGSFINVVVYRLPIMLHNQWHEQATQYLQQPSNKIQPFNLLTPQSNCPHCKNKIPFYLNIPIISFIILKGHCRHCQQKISLLYPATELIAALITFTCFWYFNNPIDAFFYSIFLLFLLTLTLIDINTHLLPDMITLPLLWIGIFYQYLMNTPFNYKLTMAVLGVMIGYITLFLVAYGYKWMTKKEGMGMGDVKLFAAIGAWLYFNQLATVLLIASLSGIITMIILNLFQKHSLKQPIAFGPFLCFSAVIVLFFLR